MKLLLDLQGAQSQSRQRGIGRYTLALSRAFLARAESSHEVRLLLNARFDTPTDALIATLGHHARAERRILLDLPEGIRAQPGGNPWLRQAAARTMRHAIEGLDADAVWFSSLLEGYNDDALPPDAPPAGMASVATLYDLIPLHNPDIYLGHPRMRGWYEQRIEMFRRCDLLLAISEWVRQDAIERLGLASGRVVNIGAAVDASFRKPEPDVAASAALRRRHGIAHPFVLYNGGFDQRKNVAALIEAFARLPETLRAHHQLVIVGHPTQEERTQLDAVARKSALPADSIVYTGFAPDDDLVRLYAECALFVFPSLLEGFGLPPLEAMACGAPVIVSNAASLPEVVDRRDAQFDPARVDSITERMAEALGNPAFAAGLRLYAQERAATFTWDGVADRALQALQELAHRRAATHTGGASSKRARISCVLADETSVPAWLRELDARIISPEKLSIAGEAAPFDDNGAHVLYVADANTARQLTSSMQAAPGVLLIQPSSENHTTTPDQDTLAAAYRAGGYAGLLALRNAAAQAPDPNLAALAERSLGVLCMDDRSAQQLRMQASGASLPEVAVLPAHETAAACLRQVAHAYATHPLVREARLFDEIAAIDGKPSGDDLAALASTIVAARPPGSVRRWLVDVSGIAEKDIRTGVQRVVRNTLLHWLTTPPAGVRIEPIRFSNGRYRYARTYALKLLDLADMALAEDAVEIVSGDVFVGLDWTIDTIAQAEPQLRDWHRRGASLHFIVYDLLPITLPDTFHPYARGRSEDWLRRIASMADHLVCISRATADDLRHWMDAQAPGYQFGTPPQVSDSPLGVDAVLGRGEAEPRKQIADAMHARPTLLMVGTIEPRKGYDQALEACEMLWGAGVDCNLVIVGHYGWLMETFRTRVEAHAELGRRLFWIDDAGDGELDAIYRQSTALLAASWGEGYGLPLIEAARRGLPVLARDLPVFREVMGETARYFTASGATELATALRDALAAPLERHAAPATSWPSWQQSAAGMAERIARFVP
jgi:glycosyltransferase involved in cell wall biosynthesis